MKWLIIALIIGAGFLIGTSTATPVKKKEVSEDFVAPDNHGPNPLMVNGEVLRQ